VATYICAGGIWGSFSAGRRALSRFALVLFSMGKLFTDQPLPSGDVTAEARRRGSNLSSLPTKPDKVA
jgi:hypothetical protein